MFDLLTIKEDEEAAQHSWGLRYVWDLASRRLRVLVLPVGTDRFKNATEAIAHVVNQARQSHPLSVRALGLVVASLKGNK